MKFKIIAVLLVCVVPFAVAQPALAAQRNDKGTDWGAVAKELGSAAEDFMDIKEKYDTAKYWYNKGDAIYNAKDMGERFDVVAGVVVDHVKDGVKDGVKNATRATIVGASTPTAVSVAGAVGMTAKTGTAISSLSGIAATKATLYAIGAPVASALGLTTAPAVVGGVIVMGAASAVAWGVGKLIDWVW